MSDKLDIGLVLALIGTLAFNFYTAWAILDLQKDLIQRCQWVSEASNRFEIDAALLQIQFEDICTTNESHKACIWLRDYQSRG